VGNLLFAHSLRTQEHEDDLIIVYLKW